MSDILTAIEEKYPNSVVHPIPYYEDLFIIESPNGIFLVDGNYHISVSEPLRVEYKIDLVRYGLKDPGLEPPVDP
jgi:hypothetical protein